MIWLKLLWYIFLVTGLTLVYGFVWSLCKTASDADDDLEKCCSCQKRKSMDCPNSAECYSKTEDETNGME